VDDWHDYLRMLNLLVSATCIYLLSHRFAKKSNSWNSKTRDYWFALVMWSVAGAALSIEGIIRDSPSGARLVFILSAAIATLVGLLRKGSWGEPEV
jgi:hypothetical protein